MVDPHHLDLLSGALDDALSDTERQELEKALASDPDLASELSSWRRVQSLIHELPEPSPAFLPSVADAVMAAWDSEAHLAEGRGIGASSHTIPSGGTTMEPAPPADPGRLVTITSGLTPPRRKTGGMSAFTDFLKNNPTLAAVGSLATAAAAVLAFLVMGSPKEPAPPAELARAAAPAGASAAREESAASGLEQLPPDNPLRQALEKKPEQDASQLLEEIFRKSQEAQQHQPAPASAPSSDGGQRLLEILRQSARQQQAEYDPAKPVRFNGQLIVYLNLPKSEQSGPQSASDLPILEALRGAQSGAGARAVAESGAQSDAQSDAGNSVTGGSGAASSSGDAAPAAAPSADSAVGEVLPPEAVSFSIRFSQPENTQQAMLPKLNENSIPDGVEAVRLAQGGFGKVQLEVDIDAQGQVTDVRTLDGTKVNAEGKEQVERLVAGIRGWTFRPARVGTQDVPFTLEIRIPN